VALVLRAGVVAATVLVVLGTAITFLRHPDYRSSAQALTALLAPDAPRSPAALFLALRGQAFVLAGLVLLIATPIVRVGVTAALLWRRGERRLGLFGLGVLALLLASLAIGRTAL
jgi:uncharacterized membrane protein